MHGAGAMLSLLAIQFVALQQVAGARPAQVTLVNGDLDPGDAAVVALLDRGEVKCSGTLIASGTVLTAAHCLPVDAIAVAAEGGVLGDEPIPVDEAVIHPAFDPDARAHDVALLRVSGAACAIEPVEIDRAGDALVAGRTVRFVGFGTEDLFAGSWGIKRTGGGRIEAVGDLTFTTSPDPSQPCHGDSGGAVLVRDEDGAEVLAGVVSWGDSACSSYAVHSRASAYLDGFIAPSLSAGAAACGPAGCSIAAGRPPARNWFVWFALSLSGLVSCVSRFVRQTKEESCSH